MNGLLILLVALMVIFIIMLIVMTVSIMRLTRQIRQTQQKVEAISRRVSGFDGVMNTVSIGVALARSFTSGRGFLAKYFTKKRSGNGRKTQQKTTK